MVMRVIHWVEYSFLLLFFLFLMLFFQTYNLFFLCIAWGVFPMVSYAIAHYVRKNTEVSVHAKRPVVAVTGENELIIESEPVKKAFFAMGRVILTMEIGNGFFEEKKTVEYEIAIRPKGNQITIPIRTEYCGNVLLHITKAEFPSMMSLFSLKKDVDVTAEYAVLPQRLPLPGQEQTSGGVGNEELAEDDIKGENSSQVREISPYKPGDRMQKIHWKASARKEEWMVKEYAGTLSNEITVMCELAGERKELHDIITLAYSVAAYWVEETGKLLFRWWNHAASEWRDAVVLSCEELEEALCEMFYCEMYEDIHEGYRMLKQRSGLSGKIFYVNSKPALEGIEGKGLDEPALTELSAGLVLLEVDR